MSTPVKVAPKGTREILITRSFNAPRVLVFDAFSKPAMVKQWLHGPPGWTMTTCRIDLRVGGKYRYAWRNHTGDTMAIAGEYTEVSRPERIVNTERFEPAWYDGDALATMVLTEKAGGTLMRLTARYASKKTRDEILASPMEGGLEFSYERLDQLLAAHTGPKTTTRRTENALYTGTSRPETVDAYMARVKHPLRDVAAELRRIILRADKRIGEGIFWNAPCFYYTGELDAFDPKTYKRYIVGFNFFKQDMLRLIFLRGASVKDPGGMLTGEYKDGRRLALFGSMADVRKREKDLQRIVKELVKHINT